MRQQLHRSVTFWSGLLVMGFIVWAWRDSQTHASSARLATVFPSSHASVVMIHYRYNWADFYLAERKELNDSEYAFECPALARPLFARGHAIDRADEPIMEDEDFATWVDWLEWSMTSEPKEDWLLVLPYWLILLTCAVPWCGLLIWRARRRRRGVGNELKSPEAA